MIIKNITKYLYIICHLNKLKYFIFETREPLLNLYVSYKNIATYKGWKKYAIKLSVTQNLKESIDIIFNENGQVV